MLDSSRIYLFKVITENLNGSVTDDEINNAHNRLEHELYSKKQSFNLLKWWEKIILLFIYKKLI